MKLTRLVRTSVLISFLGMSALIYAQDHVMMRSLHKKNLAPKQPNRAMKRSLHDNNKTRQNMRNSKMKLSLPETKTRLSIRRER